MSTTTLRVALLLLLSLCVPQPVPASSPSGQNPRLKPLPAGAEVLALGHPPLTTEMITEISDALGRLTNSPLSWSEEIRLRERAIAQWKKGVAFQDSIREGHARLKKDLEKVASFPIAAQPAAWEQRAAILKEELAQKPESFLNEAVTRASSLANEPLAYGKVILTKSAGQAYYEMRDYLEDVVVNFESRPTPTETLRGSVAVGREFAGFPESVREQLARSDRTWAVIRARIDGMSPDARKLLVETATKVSNRDGSRNQAGALKPETVFEIVSAAALTNDSTAAYWASRLK